MRSKFALVLGVALAAVVVSSAFATTPRGGDDEDTGPAVAEVAQSSEIVQSSGLTGARFAAAAACSSGARTLSKLGDRLYPEMGNGGYTSLHTDVHLNYDAPTNMFLPGTHVLLTDRATQCLTDFSLDFERTNANAAGPNMAVNSVTVNGQSAAFTFKQPTYPGNPNGPDDPDPAAHAVSNANPVSTTNPNPPACSPQTNGNTQNGTQCPANKLVITPSAPIAEGETFVVRVDYTGRPGVHVDGDGSTEGWFRVNTTAAPNDGSFVTTEPVGTSSWMPLNNHPSAKPTYDIYDTVNIGKTAISAGDLVGATPGTTLGPLQPTTVNPPDANFPGGSWTWHWHSPEPIASYLIGNSIGSYEMLARRATNGITYYQVQAASITTARKAINKIAMDNQEDITNFQSNYGGPYPFTTAGVIVGIPPASFEEEMQTKSTFAGGQIGGANGTTLGTLNHESFHQWFGDNVSEASFNMTFWKEGFARLAEYMATARTAATAQGGIGTTTGDAAFEASLVTSFTGTYNGGGNNWTVAPSNPSVTNLFATASTYNRPGASYVALWKILGRDRMIETMKRIQVRYGGGVITKPQLQDEFHESLPNQTAACHTRLDQFFTQWWDTAYPAGGGPNKPQITGPGLPGGGFLCAPTITYTLLPSAPSGNAGWYTGNVTLTWHVDNGFDTTTTTTGCVDQTFAADGTFTVTCSATNTIGSAGPVSVTVKRDATAPTTTAALLPTPIGEWYSPRTVTLGVTELTSGLAATSYRVDGGPWTPYTAPFFVATYGPHTVEYRSTDNAGNVEATRTISWGPNFTAGDQLAGLYVFVGGLGLDKGLTNALRNHLVDASKKLGKAKDACGELEHYSKLVMTMAGKNSPRLTYAQAHQLLSVNQIEALIGCFPAGSPRPEAEDALLGLMQTIDGLALTEPVGNDLGNRARQIAEQVATGNDNACRHLADLSKRIAEYRSKGKLTAGQATLLGDEVAAIERILGC